MGRRKRRRRRRRSKYQVSLPNVTNYHPLKSEVHFISMNKNIPYGSIASIPRGLSQKSTTSSARIYWNIYSEYLLQYLHISDIVHSIYYSIDIAIFTIILLLQYARSM